LIGLAQPGCQSGARLASESHLRRALRFSCLLGLLLWFGNTVAEEKKYVLQTPYDKAFIDVDEWRDDPVRHRYVHGGFEDTELLFSMYFPEKQQYDGRFFQPLQAVSGSENMSPAALYQANGIDFAAASGAYLIESNQGTVHMFGGSSKANAAVATYSRIIANEMYGEHRPYGYVYGGSGGAFKTLGCVENHPDIWDGSVPFVHGSPVAIPNVFTIQAHAMRILWDKFPQIVDALEPGGGGDMYANLNAEEAEALAEVTQMGFPPRAWFNVEKIAFGYTGVFTTLVDTVRLMDSAYFEDFWTKSGYLGANPTNSLKEARIRQETRIKALIMPGEALDMGLNLPMPTRQINSGVEFPAALRIENLPTGNLRGASIIVKSGESKDTVLYVVDRTDDIVMVGFGIGSFEAMAGIRPGDEITIDNSVYLASQTYHRHQMQSPEFYVWDQFKDEKGTPVYPQRPMLLNVGQSGGSQMSGNFNGKMLVMQALMDEAAFPWQADWYRSRVKSQLGEKFHDRYRLYYIDNTMHTTQTAEPDDPRPVVTTRIVSYQGALQQTLRYLIGWVEEGIEPPAETQYSVVDGQIVVPERASERWGIQPTVKLTAAGGERVTVNVGDAVDFVGIIEAPAGAGRIVHAAWDFEGAGDYPREEQSSTSQDLPQLLTVKTSYSYSRPGTYFPALRASSSVDSSKGSQYAQVQNLARVRVVVE
jgi:hypothetical protein